MRLEDFIKENFNGRNNQFAARYKYTDQQVGVMLKKGIYHVYDNKVFYMSRDLGGL